MLVLRGQYENLISGQVTWWPYLTSVDHDTWTLKRLDDPRLHLSSIVALSEKILWHMTIKRLTSMSPHGSSITTFFQISFSYASQFYRYHRFSWRSIRFGYTWHLLTSDDLRFYLPGGKTWNHSKDLVTSFRSFFACLCDVCEPGQWK